MAIDYGGYPSSSAEWISLRFTPDFTSSIGHFSPAAYAIDGFNALFLNNGGLEDVIVPLLVLFGPSTVLLALISRASSMSNENLNIMPLMSNCTPQLLERVSMPYL